MSRDSRVSLDWGDDKHDFRLAIGQLRELQEKCNAGPAELLTRLRIGTWRVDDLREIIRLGLIGGGLAPTDALKLVRTYVEGRPLMESVQIAHAILFAALVGVADEPVGRKKAKPAKAKKEAAKE